MALRVLCLLAGLGLTTHTASAKGPPNLFGVAHLANQSTAKATVYYKWGNGAWKKVVVERGQSMAFAWAYDGTAKASPELRVRIDVDTDGVKYVEHTLTRGQSPDNNSGQFGHRFAIKQLAGTDTRFIEAVSPKAKVTVTDRNSSRP